MYLILFFMFIADRFTTVENGLPRWLSTLYFKLYLLALFSSSAKNFTSSYFYNFTQTFSNFISHLVWHVLFIECLVMRHLLRLFCWYSWYILLFRLVKVVTSIFVGLKLYEQRNTNQPSEYPIEAFKLNYNYQLSTFRIHFVRIHQE